METDRVFGKSHVGIDDACHAPDGSSRSIALYDGFQEFSPRYFFACRSVDDVQAAIRYAAAERLGVRAMGLGFSWADHVVTSDVCVSVRALNRIHWINPETKRVSVEAGARLGDVSYALALHGLSLPSLPFLSEMTVGGAIACASHGTSHRYGTVSDFVRSMDVVLANGEVRHFGPESMPQELCAARVAIGMLGVVVRAELQAIDMPWVRYAKLAMTLPAFLSQRRSLMEQYTHIWGHWELGTQHVEFEFLETFAMPKSGFQRYVEYRNGCWEPAPILRRLLRPGWRRIRHSLRRRHLAAVQVEQQPASSAKIRISMQYGVGLEEIESAVQALAVSSLSRESSGRMLELKFLKGSELSFLGPNAGRDSVLFNAWWLVPRPSAKTALKPFEDTMRKLAARPHWGKIHGALDPVYLASAFSGWGEFEDVRRRLDPAGIFNPFRQVVSTSAV